MEEMAMISDPHLVKERIESNLDSLKDLASADRSRAEIIEELAK
jgi:hypothetical protein